MYKIDIFCHFTLIGLGEVKVFFFGAPKSISSFYSVLYLGVTAGIEPAA
jgi:hypothetical protein